jgi:hypothetical protein
MQKEVKSRATRTPDQVLRQQNEDADRDRAKLPAVVTAVAREMRPLANGFDEAAVGSRVIRGSIPKFGTDGAWTVGGSPMPSAPLMALSTTTCLQRFPKEGGAPDTITRQAGETLPDPDELNDEIPESEWATGLDGKPRPPWAKNWVVYLLNPKDASAYTFINSTAGARISVEQLEERVRLMRRIRGANVVPIVELTSANMKTQWGQKKRPEFKIIDWREIGGDGSAARQIEQQADVGKPVTPPTISEELNDEINF